MGDHSDIDHTGLTGVGAGANPQVTTIELGHASDTTLARASAGNITVEGNALYRAGGTDVAIADGGTGASTATAAFDALSPMTTAGDIIIGGASGTGTRLAAGSTSGHVLTSNGAGAAPSWQAAAGGAVATDAIWDAAGDLAVGSGANTAAKLTKGSNGDVLSVVAGAVAWAAPSGGGSPDAAGSIVNTKTYAAVSSGGSVALGFTPTNGNIILAYITSNLHDTTSLSQTNVTWTLVCRGAYHSGNEQMVDIWKGVVAASPGTSVTVNFAGNNAQGAAFEEWNGISTVDAAEGWTLRVAGNGSQDYFRTLPWPGSGGRAIVVVGNSTGNAIAVPTGWTRNIAAGSYGGSASCSILTRDESATGNTAAAIRVDPVASDVHVAAFVHLVP